MTFPARAATRLCGAHGWKHLDPLPLQIGLALAVQRVNAGFCGVGIEESLPSFLWRAEERSVRRLRLPK